jgi:two-component system, cell cycle sensor histidine kinase and response regulator CckA
MTRILIVDDNPAIHVDFRKILCPDRDESSGLEAAAALILGTAEPVALAPTPLVLDFELTCASQGQEALQLVKEALAEGRPFAVAFVDIRMPPGWDGVETLAHLWQADPGLQAVICTAYSDYTWSDIAGRLARPDQMLLLKKPFDALEAIQMATMMAEKWLSHQREAEHRAALDALLRERTAEAMQATAASAESEERFALAFDSSPTPLAIVEANGLQWSSLNRAFRKLTGWAGHASLPIEMLFADAALRKRLADPEQTVRQVRARIPSGESTRDVLISREFFSIRSQPHLMLTMEDITGQIEAETKLRQAQKMEAVGQLAAGVAHDFNNIMTVILGHVSTCMTEPGLAPHMRSALDATHHAGMRAAALTRQLLAFGRKQVMQINSCRASVLLEQNSDMLARLIGPHIPLQISFPDDLPSFTADANSFHQVLLNLAINARDAMPNGGEIRISGGTLEADAAYTRRHRGSCEGSFVRITFQDTGAGMDELTRAHLFEPFFTTKPVGEGTGLGLSTVHGIMAQHGGWIECESSPGAGATFHLYFPRAGAATMAAVETIVMPTILPAGNGTTILVVEDEMAIRMMLCAILRRFGFRVLEAGDATEALVIWENQAGQPAIDALFTDVVMPGGMSGLHLARKLMEDKPDLKVVISSGYSTDLLNSSEVIDSCGCYLPKPYDLDGVSRALSTVFPAEDAA